MMKSLSDKKAVIKIIAVQIAESINLVDDDTDEIIMNAHRAIWAPVSQQILSSVTLNKIDTILKSVRDTLAFTLSSSETCFDEKDDLMVTTFALYHTWVAMIDLVIS